MSPRLTMAIQDGGHVTRRSVVFLFLDFYFQKNVFPIIPVIIICPFLYSTHFCPYLVSWYHETSSSAG